MNGWFDEQTCDMSSNVRFCEQEVPIHPELSSAPKSGTYCGLPGPCAAAFNWDGAGTISGGSGCLRVAALGDRGWSFKGGGWRGGSGGLFHEKGKMNIKSKSSDDRNDKTNGFDK